MVNALIIGGGFAGCCSAHRFSKQGWRVTLIERASFLGGGCKTFSYGGHPYTFGPRHFLTRREEIFAYLNQHVPLRRIPGHEFLTYVESDAAFYHYPIHRDEVGLMPDRAQIEQELSCLAGVEAAKNLEEYWIGSVGRTLYDKFVNTYSKKMWRVASNTEIDDFSWSPKGVALKTGPKAAWTEAISAFPTKLNGYDDYFEIATRDATVHLNTTIEAYDLERYRVKVGGEWFTYDVIVNTISPEIVMNSVFGPLRWIGRELLKIVLPIPEAFPPHVYFLYYANDEPFTRIVEYKKFYRYESPTTLLGIETPSFKNQLYPYPVRADQARARQYLDAMPPNVVSIGRAGSYQYRVDVGLAIEQAFDAVQRLTDRKAVAAVSS